MMDREWPRSIESPGEELEHDGGVLENAPEVGLEIGERGEMLEEFEGRLVEDTHDRTAGWMRKMGKSRLGRWMFKFIVAANLFASETALADHISHSDSSSAEVESDEKLPPVPDQARAAIVALLGGTGEGRASLMVTTHQYLADVDNFVGVLDEVGEGIIDRREPVHFDALISNFSIIRDIDGRDFPTGGEWDIQTSEVAGAKEKYANLRYVDAYGNLIVVFVVLSADGTEAFENIAIYPAPPFAKQGERKTTVPLKIDLSMIGLGEIDGVFYQESLPPGTTVGLQKIPVYSHMVAAEKLEGMMEKHGDSIGAGIERVRGWFGQEDDYVDAVYVTDRDHANAGAFENNRGVLEFTDEIFHQYRPDDPRRALDEREMELVAAHEAIHEVDFRFGITKDMDLQSGIFHARSSSFLKAINESEFLGAFGGHATENFREAFASLLNTLSLPDVFWEGVVMDEDSPGFREEYLGALSSLRTGLRSVKEIPKNAEIFRILDRRIAFLLNQGISQ